MAFGSLTMRTKVLATSIETLRTVKEKEIVQKNIC